MPRVIADEFFEIVKLPFEFMMGNAYISGSTYFTELVPNNLFNQLFGPAKAGLSPVAPILVRMQRPVPIAGVPDPAVPQPEPHAPHPDVARTRSHDDLFG
jgi:hypothetical protein